MAQVHESIVINAPAQNVWELAGDPERIHEWVPALTNLRASDGERTCTTADGQEVVERVLEHSEQRRFYTYEIVTSPFPVRRYVSSIAVGGHDGHTHVDWVAELDAESPEQEPELVESFSQLYRDSLISLRDRVEGAAV